MKYLIIDIKESEAIYFNHLTFDIKGYEVLNRLFNNKDFKKQQKILEEKRIALVELLIEKYIDFPIKNWYVNVDIQTLKMEIQYE